MFFRSEPNWELQENLKEIGIALNWSLNWSLNWIELLAFLSDVTRIFFVRAKDFHLNAVRGTWMVYVMRRGGKVCSSITSSFVRKIRLCVSHSGWRVRKDFFTIKSKDGSKSTKHLLTWVWCSVQCFVFYCIFIAWCNNVHTQSEISIQHIFTLERKCYMHAHLDWNLFYDFIIAAIGCKSQ